MQSSGLVGLQHFTCKSTFAKYLSIRHLVTRDEMRFPDTLVWKGQHEERQTREAPAATAIQATVRGRLLRCWQWRLIEEALHLDFAVASELQLQMEISLTACAFISGSRSVDLHK